MEDQVQYLNSICIPAIAITDVEDPEIIQQILTESFSEMLIGVAIDGAHCIIQW